MGHHGALKRNGIIVPLKGHSEAPYLLIPAHKRRLLYEILDWELGSEKSEKSCVSKLIDSEQPCHNIWIHFWRAWEEHNRYFKGHNKMKPWMSFLRKWKIKQVNRIKIIRGSIMSRRSLMSSPESLSLFFKWKWWDVFPIAKICLKSIRNKSNKQMQVETGLHIYKTIEDENDCSEGLCF